MFICHKYACSLTIVQISQTRLKAAINHFYACVLAWSPLWFNKPKFHILIHILEHILHFGPAVLFATENFESYNAVIRGWSIHSNRQAPSRDIAHQAAEASCIRHLMSGGYFLWPVYDEHGNKSHRRRSIGPGPLALVMNGPKFLRNKLGLPDDRPIIPGKITPAQCSFQTDLLVAHILPCFPGITTSRQRWIDYPQTFAATKSIPNPSPYRKVRLAMDCILVNGDRIKPGFFVISQPTATSIPILGKVVELLICTDEVFAGVDFILVQSMDVGSAMAPYQMPGARPQAHWQWMSLKVRLSLFTNPFHLTTSHSRSNVR